MSSIIFYITSTFASLFGDNIPPISDELWLNMTKNENPFLVSGSSHAATSKPIHSTPTDTFYGCIRAPTTC